MVGDGIIETPFALGITHGISETAAARNNNRAATAAIIQHLQPG
jgi:hypothetical protein